MRLLVIVLCSLLLFGCLGGGFTDLKDVNENPGKYLGEKVHLKGNVTKAIRLGKISGFTLVNEGGSIPVSSQMLPAEGSEVIIRGTLMKETLIGYYVLVDDIKTT